MAQTYRYAPSGAGAASLGLPKVAHVRPRHDYTLAQSMSILFSLSPLAQLIERMRMVVIDLKLGHIVTAFSVASSFS